ncbi:MAG: hypothetical protein P8Y54_05035 [Xanthomonadales bacterium]
MEYHYYDFIGNVGVALILGSYLLVQLRRLVATDLANVTANGVGAACVLYSLFFDFNLSAFIIEAVWLLISLVGLVRILRERRIAAT